MTNDEILTALNDRTDELLKKLVEPIKRYRRTQEELHCCDVSKDGKYRQNFANFYRLSRRKGEWRDQYFDLLESLKTDSDVRFDDVLRQLHVRTGRIEPSFSSKLVATINPRQPVVDSVVLGILEYKQPYTYQKDRIERLIDLYDQLTNRLQVLIQDDRFVPLKSRFTSVFPDCKFTDVKILDLYMWQLR